MTSKPDYPGLVQPVLKALETSALPAADFDLVPLTDAFAHFLAQQAVQIADADRASRTQYAARKVREALNAMRGPDAVRAND